MAALTYEEAQERSRLLDVRGYRVEETGALAGSLRRRLADQVEDLRRAVAVRATA